MISEMYTTSFGARSRGSYGNIHNHSSRLHFGSSRAMSLDQYNSRRLSDGVQAIVSDDSSMFYNRQHRSLDNEVIYTRDRKLMSESGGSSMVGGVGSTAADNGEYKNDDTGNSSQNKNIIYNISSNSSSSKHMTKQQKHQASSTVKTTIGTRTFMSTLRQLKDSFSFSFEKDLKKRVVASSVGCQSIASVKNNNPELIKVTTYNLKKDESSRKGGTTMAVLPANKSRGRACSLDVPVRLFYNCDGAAGSASIIGQSRKSSSNNNDDNNSNKSELDASANAGGVDNTSI